MTDRDTSQDTSQVDTTTDATETAADATAQPVSAEPAASAATDVAADPTSDGTPASTANGATAEAPASGTSEPAPDTTPDGPAEAAPEVAEEVAASEAASDGAADSTSGSEAATAPEASEAATAPEAEASADATAPEASAAADPSETAPATSADATATETAPEAESEAATEAALEATATETAPEAAPEASAPEASGEATATETAPEAAPEATAPEASAAAAVPAAPHAPHATPAPPAEHHEPVPPPTAAMPHTQPATAVPAAPVSSTPVAEASANPGKWGRVDADGTVYVKTADGERAVGSWHAGEPAEGLAHYARRFDDVRTEVELLVARLGAGSGDPKHTLTNAKHIKESLTDAALVGDLEALATRIDHVLERAQQAVESVRHARDEARGQAMARKQELVAEVEKIAESSTQWKVAGDRLRAILDEWKTIKGVDRKTDDQLWKRFSKARDMFNRRRGSHFADLDRQRAAAKERKQELVTLAEEISDSDDWGPTAARYRELMTEWKAAGRAPKEADDALWQQFRAAQDKFFSRRSAVFNERDAELVENAKRKEALIAEAEKINPATDLDAARAHLHRIQEKWDDVGKVPRERIRELEGKLRAVEDKVRNAADAQWRRTDPEAEARAAQFRERVEQFEAQAAKARAAGDKRRAEQAEAQAAQWREWLAAAENAVASR
jgi:hypothetical protein